MKIFAYGSNMCTARLRARVPSARPIRPAALPGHTLRFHKRGFRDGSGKADAAPCDAPGAALWGVLYLIRAAEKADLDRAEGLGYGYDAMQVTVTDTAARSHRAWIYRASEFAIDADLLPFAWYQALVLAGAEEHGLPPGYIRARIASQRTRLDHDTTRAERHRAILVTALA